MFNKNTNWIVASLLDFPLEMNGYMFSVIHNLKLFLDKKIQSLDTRLAQNFVEIFL